MNRNVSLIRELLAVPLPRGRYLRLTWHQPLPEPRAHLRVVTTEDGDLECPDCGEGPFVECRA